MRNSACSAQSWQGAPLHLNLIMTAARWAFLAVLTLLVGLLFAQQQFRLPAMGLFGNALNNTLHVPWFALVTLLLWRLIGPKPAIVLAVAFVIAGLSELVQLTTERQPSWYDWFLDLVAASCTVGVLSVSGVSRWGHRSLIAGWLLLAVAAALAQPVWVASGRFYQAAIWPALIDTSDPRGSIYAVPNTQTELINSETRWRDGPPRALRVQLTDRPWPGIHLKTLRRSWRDFDELVVDVFIEPPGIRRFYLATRVVGSGGTAAWQEFDLTAGSHRLVVAVQKLAPDGVRVSDVLVYGHQDDVGGSFLLGRAFLRAKD